MYRVFAVLTLFILTASFAVAPPAAAQTQSLAAQSGASVNPHTTPEDAEAGNELWRRSTGGNIHAAPVTYAVGGKQRVSIASGHAIFTFGLAEK